MKKSMMILWAMLMVFGALDVANATLYDNGNGTITQIRNDGSSLMWLQDANLAKTSGYHPDGRMTLVEATLWAYDYLNNTDFGYASIGYLGYSDWRLPYALPVNGIGYDFSWSSTGSTDHGYNITSPNSEMSYMYYVELGNLGYHKFGSPPGVDDPPPEWGPNPNTCVDGVCFDNVMWTGYTQGDPRMDAAAYWAISPCIIDLNNDGKVDGIDFRFKYGDQNVHPADYYNYAWAVRDVAPVPEPATMLLLGSGLLGLAGFRRRFRKR